MRVFSLLGLLGVHTGHKLCYTNAQALGNMGKGARGGASEGSKVCLFGNESG